MEMKPEFYHQGLEGFGGREEGKSDLGRRHFCGFFFVCFIFCLFSCRPFLKSLLNLLQYCCCFFFFFMVCFSDCEAPGNLSSQTREWTCIPCNGRRSLNHWTAREVPGRRCFWEKHWCGLGIVERKPVNRIHWFVGWDVIGLDHGQLWKCNDITRIFQNVVQIPAADAGCFQKS